MAKMLNYLGGGWACDSVFTLFVISWIITRHFIFGKIIWAIYAELPSDIPWVWDPSQGLFVTTSFWIAFLGLLLFLQVILLFWLWIILRIMWGVIVGKGADDDRSDTDESEIESREIKEKESIDPRDARPLLINTPRLESIGKEPSSLYLDEKNFDPVKQH